MAEFLIGLLAQYAIALLAFLAVLGLHRRYSLALWAYIAAFLPDWPLFLQLAGVQSLDTLFFLSHTAGIFVHPLLLIVLDIFLIEASLLQYLKPVRNVLPKWLKKVLKAEEVLERFQRYHTIPLPERLGRVYMAGLLGGIVHLAVYLAFGF